MPAIGKETERPLTPNELSQFIEPVGYVEQVEKQTEIQQPSNITTQQSVPEVNEQFKDMGKAVSAQFAVQTKPNIILPMNQQEITEGLHQKVWKGVRWASEYCVMMIKKYPGRVFYLPAEKR